MEPRVTLTVALVLAFCLSACTSDGDPAAVAATCTPMPVLGDHVEGSSDDGTSVSALLERTANGPLRAGEAVKVVVRMTGAGDLQVSVIGPSGDPTAVDWGPEAHTSSNFGRPGSEWGFGVTFPEPGCWTIALSRTETGSAYVQLDVA